MIRLFPLLLAFAACFPKTQESAPQDTSTKQIVAVSAQELESEPPVIKLNYDSLKAVCVGERNRLRSLYQQASSPDQKGVIIRQARSFLFDKLTQEIWPQWYGTAWDFNGISEIPGEGQIACGYFVSTTLKHVGFKLNRYRLAQQGATAICKALTPTLKRFSSLEAMQAYLNKQAGEHLYIIGLDYHVGFIQQADSICSITHSSYFDPVAVADQPIATSLVLESSNAYVLAPFLDSDELVKSWLLGRQVYP